MEKNEVESRSSTTERTISSGLLLLWGCRKGIKRLMETVGRPLRRTPIPEHQIVKAFHRNPLAAILLLILFSGVALTRATETKIWAELSGEKALSHVQRLVDLGPHPGGSDVSGKARDYIEQQLRDSGWQVTRQAFNDDTPRGKIHFVNLIARFSSGANQASPSLLLCSHYHRKS